MALLLNRATAHAVPAVAAIAPCASKPCPWSRLRNLLEEEFLTAEQMAAAGDIEEQTVGAVE